MRKLLFTLIVTLALSGSILAQHETHWPEFNDSFSYVDYIVAFLEVDGNIIEVTDNWTDFEVASYANGEVRGHAFMDNYTNDGVPYPSFELPVYYENANESISFKLYDHGSQTEFDFGTCNYTIVTQGDEHYEIYNFDFNNAVIFSFTTPASGGEIVEIGEQTGTNQYLPTYSTYNYSLTQQIYTADEIGMSGTINSIAFKSTGSEKTRTLDVYFVHTTKDSFNSSSDWISVSESNLVYSGDVTFSAGEWITLDLDNPFAYDGSNNLAVIVDDNTGTWSSGMSCAVFNANGNQAIRVYNDYTNYDPSSPSGYNGTLLSVKNCIELNITSSGGSYCSRPTGLAYTLTPGNGTIATLSWTENGDASSWQICLNGDETNLIEVSENPYTLTGLTAETPYTAKVRANCGSSQSAWSNTVSFTPTNTYQITVNDGTVTNEYVPVYGYWCDQYSKSQFIIPAESLQGMIDITLTKMTFYSSDANVSWGSAEFEVYMTEVDYTSFSSTSFVDWSSMTKVMNAGSLSISNNRMVVEFDYDYQYAGGNLLVGIRETTPGIYAHSNWYGVSATSSAIGGYENSRGLSVHDFLPKTTFNFVPAGSCIRPSNLTSTDLTATTATLSWAETGEATEWDLRYKVETAESNNGNTYSFEDGMDNWTTIDADGDGHNWGLASVLEGSYSAHSGNDMVCSQSYIDNVGALTPDNYLVSPQVQLGGSISFWACAQGAAEWAAEHFGVAVSTTGNTNASDFTTIQEWTISTRSNGASGGVTRDGDRSTTWLQYTVDLSAYSGMGYVAIRHFDCTDQYYLNVDDIVISEQPEWTLVEGLTETTYTINSLAPATTYDVQVRAVCGEDNASTWTNSINFTTVCVPIATLPWSENFDSYGTSATSASAPNNYPNDVLPTCWQFLNRSQSSNSYPQTFLSSLISYAVTGNCLFINSSGTTPIYAILPEFEQDLSDLQITFTCSDQGTASIGTLYVGYMTDPTDASTFNSIYACPQGSTKKEVTVYFSNAPANGHITFMYLGVYNNEYVGIDNITVDIAPSCVPVNTLSYSEVDALFATLNWTLFDNTQTAWDVQYATTEDFSEGVQLIENVNIRENYQLEGLSPETTYYVRVRANCGGGDTSVWSNAISFTTPIACYVPTNLAVTGMTENSAVASWTAGSEDQSEWQLQYKTLDAEQWTLVEGLTETTYTFNGLTSGMGYEVQVRANCGGVYGLSEWSSIVWFNTLQTPWNLTDNPYSTDFENGYDWVLENGTGTYTNVWVYGEAINNTTGGSHSLYVSNDGGATNSYTISTPSAVYATKLFTLAEGFYSLSYDWNAYGENTWDFLRVALVPVGGTWPTYVHDYYQTLPENWINADGGMLQLSNDWQTNYVEVQIQTAGDYYLTFGWFNDGSVGTDPPGAIDNVSFASVSCVTPISLNADVTPHTATLSWTSSNEGAWDIAYRTIREEEFTIIEGVEDNPYTLSGLASETEYVVKIRSNCGETLSHWSNEYNFTTPIACNVPTNLAVSDISDDFATVTWTAGNGNQNNWDLRYKTINEEVWTMVEGLAATTYTLNGLVTSTAYEVQVRANCGGGDLSEWSNSVNFITNLCPLEEQCIINYSLSDSYGDGWNGNAIQVVDVETNLVFATLTLGSGSYGSGSISLCPDRNYNFVWIEGGWSNECSFVLTDAYGGEILAGDHLDLPFNFANCDITCKRPKNLTATTIQAYSAELTWESGEAWDLAYRTSYTTNFTVIENLVDNTYTLSDLTPETTYIVKVRSNCGENVSYWSEEYSFTTPEACPKPTNVSSYVSFEYATISWTPGNETQSEWEFQYRMASQSEWTTVTGLTEPTYTINGLGNSTTYYVRVRGICDVPSNWTYPISFTSEQIYTFNTYVDENIYPMNTIIPIHGTVTNNLSNAPVANLEVEIGVTVMGWRRTLTAVTDGNGQFTANFEPMPLESGYYTVNSGTVGNSSSEVHDSFDILGMNVMEYTLNEGLGIENNQWLLCNVIQNIPKSGHILIKNRNSFDLTNLQVNVLSAPQGAEFTFTPMAIAGLHVGYMAFTATGTILTEGNEYQEVRLKVTCDQGAEAIFTMWFYCEEARGILNISPTALNTTMTRGLSKTIDVTLSNNGQAATGEITVSLPNEEWMSVVGGTTLPSIEVGETATFTLRLSPDNTVPLTQFSGTIGVNCEHGEAVSLPYSILAVSEANGALLVDVTDEFTTNTNGGNGPHVEGAEVTLTSYYTHETVAHGFTAADGTFLVEDIAEGYYFITVQSNSHTRYDGIIYVEAGITNQQNMFLQYQCVSYSWVVEPTEIQDEYEIVLDIEFEVDVPVPVITVSAPACIPDVPLVGDSYTFNYVITNHGLIDAYNLTLYAAETEHFLFTPLYDFIDTLHAHQSVEIPCVVTRKNSDPIDCGEWGATRVQYSYLSGANMMYNQAIAYTRLGSCTSCPGPLPTLTGNGGYGGGGGGAPTYGGGGGGSVGITYPVVPPEIINQLDTINVRVGVQFSQTLTMTREAFIGTFAVHNGHDTNAVEGIGLDFIVKDAQGIDRTNLFQISTMSIEGVTGIDGNGTLAAGSDGLVKILFIPTRDAAPTEPIMYSFGGTFTFVDPWNGITHVMDLYPTELEVHPCPDLYIDYFVAEDVYGDNPFTPQIEPSIPAELAVMIWNKGVGTAKNVILESAQPVIVSNAQGLLIDFDLYGAYIDGVGALPGLNRIEFGNIESGQKKIGEWLFTSSLLAHVVSYDAHVIHNNSFGNPNLSLVSHVGIHKLTHAIQTYGSRIDNINDFLVNDIPDENNYPDSIFFSDGRRTSVGVVESMNFDKYVTSHDTIVTLTVNPSRVGWNYGESEDPGKNLYELVSCTRNNDGQEIPLSNIWQEAVILHETGDSLYANKLRIVDSVSTVQTVTYTLVFAGNPSDPYIFFGDQDEYWSNAANWEGNAKPHNANNNVLIDGICLLDEDVTVSSLTVIEGMSLTIPEDRILTVSNNLENTITTGLVIEEGGQLMHANAGTQATVRKDIEAYTNNNNGWYLIASPLAGNTAVTAVNNMLSNSYDLYYYDEPTYYWMNQEFVENNFTELENGKGYLYANDEEVTLEFAGELQDGSATVNVPLSYTADIPLSGFNLVGNPFVHNVTSYASENVADGCYLTNETMDDLMVDEINEENPLKPSAGFFVKATGEEASVTFNPGRGTTTTPSSSIRVEVSENGKIIDRLIVKREGEPLEKLSLNEIRTKLFATQDHQEIAIVPCEGNEQPVNFKAAKEGNYTINVNAVGMEFHYLHLIDNLTGEDVDLLAEPSYTFEARTSDYASRFLLRFILREGDATETENFAYFFNDKLIIANEGKATLQMVDLLGHILYNEQINGSCEKQINAAPGVYTLRLIKGSNMKVQKVVVKR